MSSRTRPAAVFFLVTALVLMPSQEAVALIVGGEGNKPLTDPGWPQGAAAVINTPARIAWWEGPPLGGGQWHAECAGDAKALSDVLADFAKLDVKSKRIVLHDGVGQSFWLNPNNVAAKRAAARMDWSFMVWVPASWQRLHKLPADLNPTDPKDAADGPPAQIDVYTGGSVKWADVIVPQGLTVVDDRLVAHGFKLADGVVFEGKVIDLATKMPIAAKVRLERVEPQPMSGYRYPQVTEVKADTQGRWVLKKTPEGWYRVVIEAKGFVPRVAGYARVDDQPRWQAYDSGLARPAAISGRVTDDAGQPLAGVEVRIADVTSAGRRYEAPLDYKVTSAKDGSFRADQVPIGKATLWVHKPGYCRPGLGQQITTPSTDIELTMVKSARVEVTVDFTGKERPAQYIVRMRPEGGDKIGSFGGSGQINDNNQMVFENVPPGRYTFSGQPNPGSADQQTEPVTVEVKGGQSAKVTLNAK